MTSAPADKPTAWSLFARAVRRVGAFTKHWFVQLAVACFLIVSALAEILEIVDPDDPGVLGIEHALVVVGLAHAVRAMNDFVDGLDGIERADRRDSLPRGPRS